MSDISAEGQLTLSWMIESLKCVLPYWMMENYIDLLAGEASLLAALSKIIVGTKL